jgi:hypothetical protein
MVIRMKNNVLMIISILLGIVALVLSWQTYQISLILKQLQPKILLVDHIGDIDMVSSYGGRNEPAHFVCPENIRLQNIGGAVTSLTDYDVIVSYNQKTIQYENNRLSVYAFSKTNISPAIFSFRSALFNYQFRATFAAGGFSDAIPLPFQIAPYSAQDLYLVTDYILDLNVINVSQYPLAKNNLAISYKLHFASGQVLEVPFFTCQYLFQ